MNDKRMRLERIVCPETVSEENDLPEDGPSERPAPANGTATVISLSDKLKR